MLKGTCSRMADKLLLRVKSRERTFSLNDFTSQSKLSSLMKAIEDATNILQCNQSIRIGFPAKEIWSYRPSLSLNNVGIKSRETLIVTEVPAEERKIREAQRNKELSEAIGCFMIHSVPSNNSCLFTSISFLADGGSMSSREMRSIVAGIVLSDSEKYSSSVLDRRPEEYAEWIQRGESWGGAIELSIFSEYYKMEFDVVDVQTLRVDRFGCEKCYPLKSYLLYDGVHYDALVLNLPNGSTQSKFSSDDDQYTLLALEVAKELHKKRSFTDLGSFSIMCQTCSTPLKGQVEAVVHAQKTGHSNFREINQK
jgi:ubiquitin thioesterase OTU1